VWVAVGGAVGLVRVTLASALLTLAESKEIGWNLMLHVPLGAAVSMTAALYLLWSKCDFQTRVCCMLMVNGAVLIAFTTILYKSDYHEMYHRSLLIYWSQGLWTEGLDDWRAFVHGLVGIDWVIVIF